MEVIKNIIKYSHSPKINIMFGLSLFCYAVRIGKKESKMAVDKRERREKHTKSGTKEGLRIRVRTSGEKNSPPG